MPLNKSGLTDSLKNAFLENLQQPDADSEAMQKAEQAVEKLANTFANAIETYVKSGLVVGTCPSGGGPLTGGAVT